MPDKYPGRAPAPWKPSDGFPHDASPPVEHVERDFARLSTVGDYLAMGDAGLIPGREYTETNFGANRAKNHFQGIQRLAPPNDDFVVISGGDAIKRTSQLFVFRVESRRKGRWWGTNLRFSRKPPKRDRLVRMFTLHDTYWHGGGISLLGDVLAVPLEDGDARTSRIVFLDVTDPGAFKLLPEGSSITRTKSVGKAGAVALTKLPNHRYVCAVWSDSDDLPVRVDFYLSNTHSLLDGFQNKPLSWEFSRLLPVGGRASKYQSINFVMQQDGELYLVGTENTSGGAPLVGGDDYADLLHVEFPDATLKTDNPRLADPTITRVAERRMRCEDDYANMDAAAGIYIEPQWRGGAVDPVGRLGLYAGYHWRIDKRIRVIEFRPELPRTAPPITQLDDAWVDLFEHMDFRGRRLSILGNVQPTISNYKRVLTQDHSFGDTVSSARFQIPEGWVYRLYKDQNRKGKAFDLRGTGCVEEIPNLAAEGFNDQASSSEFKMGERAS